MIYDVTVIGAGPAGLAASLSAKESGASVFLIEREARLGGILKQCIHDGFGLIRFKEKLSGPEYTERYIDMVSKTDIVVSSLTFVTKILKSEKGYVVTIVNRNGVSEIETKTIILATGCRERTAKQVFINGTRPSGVLTAGTAQYYVNILGKSPAKKCVILGSGDIGLIMARRLTLEGAKVVGVYEVKSTPSGLARNIAQCLNDYDIPLYLSHTVTRVFGEERLTGVEIAEVDERFSPKIGTEQYIECDSLILSVGLIPENEVASSLNIPLDGRTKGPIVDQTFMTGLEGIFSCGNALHVNDLVDYVSEGGGLAGSFAAKYLPSVRKPVNIEVDNKLLYVVPQTIDILNSEKKVTFYFRSKDNFDNLELSVCVNDSLIKKKKYAHLRPPEMESLLIDFSDVDLSENAKISFKIDGGQKV